MIKIGHEQLKNILIDNYENEKNFNLILSIISDKFLNTKRDDRKEFVRIFSILTEENKRIKIYLPKIIILLQSFIIEENSKYFNIISETFGKN